MNNPNPIRLADLLMERDMAFVRVAECERQIQAILGVPYPFPTPPDLPSLRRKKPAKTAIAQERLGVSRHLLKVRPLKKPDENAYRVEYRRDDEVVAVSFLTDADLLRRLLPLDTPAFRITAIATVSFTSPEQCAVVAELWHSRDPRPASSATPAPEPGPT